MFPSTPTLTTGAFTAVTTVSATLPTFSVGSRTWPSKTVTIDFTQWATAIAMIRGFLEVIIVVSFFLLGVRTLRGAVATAE
jgi:hypothetical protein